MVLYCEKRKLGQLIPEFVQIIFFFLVQFRMDYLPWRASLRCAFNNQKFITQICV